MKNYTIIPLDIDHIEEICADIKYQSDAGIAECALFLLQLQPWGNPPADKTEALCEKYDLFRTKLEKMGVETGILVQCSMANASEDSPFKKVLNIRTGEMLNNFYCPADLGFREYMKNALTIVARHNPAVIMLDDDIRLLTLRGGFGCGCKLHMAEFNRRAGTNMTKEQLFDILSTDSKSEYAQIYLDVQRDSLVEYVKYIRLGVDSVNPKIRGIYCTVCGEFAAEIAETFAGTGNPVTVRLNNGNYGQGKSEAFSFSMMRAALQRISFKDRVDVLLAETDTCPHNRYSKSAHSLHAHFVGSILEGAKGAKHWLQRTSAYEPGSGKAYRAILEKYSGFYHKLSEIVPNLTYSGCRIPINKLNFFDEWDGVEPHNEAWAQSTFDRLGIPFYFSAEHGGTVCLNGDRDRFFSDDEIDKMLSGNVFLASDTAKNLIDRGFGKYLGVDVRPWKGKSIRGERYNGIWMQKQINAQELVPMSECTKTDSVVYHLEDDGKTETILFPATTIYENTLGGKIVVFCGTPQCGALWSEGYSFMNETRKKQLIGLLEYMDVLKMYYPGDTEVYLRAATMTDGRWFCAFFNIGQDPLESIELVIHRDVNRIEKLMPDGSAEKCVFENTDGIVNIKTPANILEPVILFIS